MRCSRSKGIRTDQLWKFEWFWENSFGFNSVFPSNCITYFCFSYNEITRNDVEK